MSADEYDDNDKEYFVISYYVYTLKRKKDGEIILSNSIDGDNSLDLKSDNMFFYKENGTICIYPSCAECQHKNFKKHDFVSGIIPINLDKSALTAKEIEILRKTWTPGSPLSNYLLVSVAIKFLSNNKIELHEYIFNYR